jgi:bacterioferritin-associated ferredoxin
MIVCSCQHIACNDIHAAFDWMRASDPDTLITPGKGYRALGKQADCGGCMPLFLETMRKNPKIRIIPNQQAFRLPDEKDDHDEGRRESY